MQVTPAGVGAPSWTTALGMMGVGGGEGVMVAVLRCPVPYTEIMQECRHRPGFQEGGSDLSLVLRESSLMHRRLERAR